MRLLSLVFLGLVACQGAEDATREDSDEVIVDTRTRSARRQYDANVSFASSYTSRCKAPDPSSTRPRVLVTGFGRFMQIADNATGRILSALVPEARYPMTKAPRPGEVDPPEAQLSVGSATLDLPGIGEVDVCAMILPVYWDLATILVAKELDVFKPSFVMMNGVAGERQPLWLELGATNRAAAKVDGSNQLAPAMPTNGDPMARILESESLDLQPNRLAWMPVRDAARAAIAAHADEVDGGQRFDSLVNGEGAVFAGFPRSSNTYLCNHMTFVTGWMMNHPDTPVSLLRASPEKPGAINSLSLTMRSDLREVPRVFVHWPSELASRHHAAGADVMRAIITAQLTAGADSSPGDNTSADPSVSAGEFF